MKKMLLIVTLIIGIVSCSKDESSEHYSKSNLEGYWYVIDIKRPNGNYASQSTGLEREAFECQKQYSFSFSKDNLRIIGSMPYYNGYGVSCNKQEINVDYKIKGNRIEISEGKEKLETYRIISLKDNRLEITFTDQMKKMIKEGLRGYVHNPTSLSMDDLLNSVMILERY
ncbi:exported hypothetical protein [Capnocytophaga canimorsus]|uniref:Lipocalin-like domain-containing protein n=1 Tax=Capnocytophaga canimorsus TaxID=28188 RepID=A0A0B7IR67_9FLAO|nr:lipocalin family protein [Capnocytophaga canimorsus]CEN52517.1 exported hypothetical protein [Capnocytophaga canimorsus]